MQIEGKSYHDSQEIREYLEKLNRGKEKKLANNLYKVGLKCTRTKSNRKYLVRG